MKTRRTGFDNEGLKKGAGDGERQSLRHMEASDGGAREEAEAAEFRELLGDHLSRWDERMEPPVPRLAALEQLVSQRKGELSRKLWRDLLLLWTLGIFIIGSVLLILQWNIAAFAGLQAAALIGAIVYLFVLARKERSVKREWTT
ncbi:DUF5345 domain-containing protein [Cohnella lubricantis]|uniref:YxlC family protein n=1 Tax=Cohnella lubricantis TaxID=2163172 RepID=A0A841TDZ5_9BACL|nr:DUF5345 family protein [Cohnella lubricantis]MBB6679504.1 YxlC family protein [Cohnella lubricantis]MBP2118096.1 hypothetical protein [Cohnella lubricantis]